MEIEENNKSVVRQFVERSNTHDLDAAWEFIHPQCRVIPLERFGLPSDPATYKGFLLTYFQALPDVSFQIDDIIAEGEKVWLRFLITGTHQGVFHSIAPTGKRITYRQMAMYKVVEGTIREIDVVTDDYAVFKQLGAYPPLSNASPIAKTPDKI